MSNILLVTGRDVAGLPTGVSPDMARAIASRLGVEARLVPFPHPDQLCDAAADNAWDVALVGADPARASKIDFTKAYCEIQATYMVPAVSELTPSDLDQPGKRISVKGGGAYDLWLTRNMKQAELVRSETLDESYEAFHSGRLDALAGLRPKLIEDLAKAPGQYKLLDGYFMAVQQALGCLKTTGEDSPGFDFLCNFVEEAKASGLVQELIDRHGVTGKLSVASPA